MVCLYSKGSTSYTPQRTHRSFTDQINSLGNTVEQTSVLNTEIIKEALANDSLTNLDLNTGKIETQISYRYFRNIIFLLYIITPLENNTFLY